MKDVGYKLINVIFYDIELDILWYFITFIQKKWYFMRFIQKKWYFMRFIQRTWYFMRFIQKNVIFY